MAQPAENEGLLGYSAIADLLASADAELTELPDPQREAIEVALLRTRPRHPLSAQAVAVGTTRCSTGWRRTGRS